MISCYAASRQGGMLKSSASNDISHQVSLSTEEFATAIFTNGYKNDCLVLEAQGRLFLLDRFVLFDL